MDQSSIIYPLSTTWRSPIHSKKMVIDGTCAQVKNLFWFRSSFPKLKKFRKLERNEKRFLT